MRVTQLLYMVFRSHHRAREYRYKVAPMFVLKLLRNILDRSNRIYYVFKRPALLGSIPIFVKFQNFFDFSKRAENVMIEKPN